MVRKIDANHANHVVWKFNVVHPTLCPSLASYSLAGVSRSVTLVVAYIMTVTRLGWQEALAAVKVVRPCAGPNLGFQRQLQEFEATQADQVSPRNWARVWRRDYCKNEFYILWKKKKNLFFPCSSENGYRWNTRTTPSMMRLIYATCLSGRLMSMVGRWKNGRLPHREASEPIFQWDIFQLSPEDHTRRVTLQHSGFYLEV